MIFSRRSVMAAFAVAFASMSTAALAQDWKAKYPELVFAVIPAENASGVTDRWGPFVSYLSKELGTKVTLRIAQDYAAVIEGQKAGQIHIGSHGPASFARALMTGARIEAFAQDVNLDGSRGYYSVLYVRKDSPYQKLEDLKGKNLGLVDPNSASGYNVPLFSLGKIDIDANAYFGKVVTTGSHENAVIALQQGTVEAAFNWWNDEGESNLRRMERKKMAKYDDFRIVFKSELIPNSPMAYNADLPAELKTAIREAVLKVSEKDKEVFRKATDGKSLPWAAVENKTFDVMIELNKFVDNLRKKKAS